MKKYLKLYLANVHKWHIVVFLFLTAFLLAAHPYQKSRIFSNNVENRKPNILFIFTDDQRYNTIRALGGNEVLTPPLISLVASGTTFTHA